MTDPIDLLRRAAETTATTATLSPDPVAAVRGRVDRRHTRRRRAALLVAAIVVVAAGTVVAEPWGTDGEDLDVTAPSAPSTTTTATTAPPSSGDTPLALRTNVAMAWTGREVVVWGGRLFAEEVGVPGDDQRYADGAAFDPAAGTWRTMADGPLPPSPDEDGPVAVAVDAGIVVASGRAVALWDPDTDTWRPLDDAPSPVKRLVGGGPGALAITEAGSSALLDVAGGSWSDTEPPFGFPSPPAATAMAWTDTELVVVGSGLEAHALDLATGTWRPLADPPDTLVAAALGATWNGERVVVADYEMGAAAYDPDSDTWETLPAVPARFYEHYPIALSSGPATTVTMATTTAVLGPDDGWVPLPPAPIDRTSVAIDPPGADRGRIATWSTTATRTNQLAVIDLADLAGSDPRRQVGVGSVELTDGDMLVAARSDPATEAVTADLRAAEGGSCTVTSEYLDELGTDEQRAVREELPADDPSAAQGGQDVHVWFHDTAGRHWETEAYDSDLFVIDCDRPDAARRLAGSARLG